MRNGGIAEDRGNAILATHPLRDVVALELPPVRQRSVATAATLSARGRDGTHRELQVVSVHLENRPAMGVTGVRQRGEQMEWLLRSLPPARYSVLGGDLNTWTAGAREPAVTLTARHYPDNGARDAAPTHVLPLLPDLRLDYLFARLPDGGGMTGRLRVDDRHGSDHHPVLAWVHLP
jgi:endonuclease/exonuclease/phosphatase family metal-dependent hydrolase